MIKIFNFFMSVIIYLVLIFHSSQAAPSSDPRITGGSNADRNQFPHQASLQWGIFGLFRHICGGSIISPNRVLTAAHCITGIPSVGSLRIRAGLLNLYDSGSDVQTIDVTSRVVHPDYQGGVNPNDVAVLRLATSLSYTAAVQSIGLPSPGSVATGNAVLSGWGSTSLTNTSNMPNTLQMVTVTILTLDECGRALTAIMGTSEPLDSTNMCSGPLTGGISACSGDSGGPLIQDGEVIGVVSWGIMPCGSNGAPSVYTQVSSFVDWINQI